jgi:two-component system response regulator MprA
MSEQERTVLVVDDDEGVRTALRMALGYEGYGVVTASNGAEALDAVGRGGIDALVLDVMMPMVDGLSVCRSLRRRGDRTPILVLTARTEVSDRVAGLDAGADDYLAKPFALDELLARLRALLRRSAPVDEEGGALEYADLVVDPATRTARRGDRAIELTKTEFDLLALLLANAGQVVTREVIYERIWGFDFETNSRSLDVYVSYLRRKTEEGGEERLIHTVRGIGFAVRRS